MRLPAQNSAYQHRVRFGRYVTRRLKQAGSSQQPSSESLTKEVKQRGRAWEDSEELIQDALADRDAADARLDNLAQTARHSIAGRSLEAIRVTPYTDVFPDGLEYYTAAPLLENPKRYGELLLRLDRFLPAGDTLRDEVLAKLKEAITIFDETLKAVEVARTEQAVAASSLANAEELWARQMEKIYGVLIEQIGKAKAEKFFPQSRSRGGDEE